MGIQKNEEFMTVSCDICKRLFLTDEDGFKTNRMVTIHNLSGRYSDPE